MKTEEFRELCTEEGFDADQVREFELAISHGLNIKLLVNLACDATVSYTHLTLPTILRV